MTEVYKPLVNFLEANNFPKTVKILKEELGKYKKK